MILSVWYLYTNENIIMNVLRVSGSFLFIYLAFYGFLLTVQLKRVTGNRVRERGSDTQQRDPGCRASAHGTPALPIELNGAPVSGSF